MPSDQVLEDNPVAYYLFSKSRMIVPNNPSLNPGNITLEALISWSGDNGFQQRIIEKSRFIGGEASQYGLSILPDGKVMIEIQIDAIDSSLVSTEAIQAEKPCHVAASYDGSYMRIYIDGVLAGEEIPELNGELASNSTDLCIGNQVDRDRPFNGIISEVAIFNKALSLERIKLHVARSATGIP